MNLNIQHISVKKLDAYREHTLQKEEELAVEISINISLMDLKEADGGDFIIKATFTLAIVEYNKKFDIANICSQLDVLIKTDSKEELLSEWNNSGDKKLSESNRAHVDNAIFYFMMPLVMNLTEKMQVPVPVPPLKKKQAP